jgi:hypothetical protein
MKLVKLEPISELPRPLNDRLRLSASINMDSFASYSEGWINVENKSPKSTFGGHMLESVIMDSTAVVRKIDDCIPKIR